MNIRYRMPGWGGCLRFAFVAIAAHVSAVNCLGQTLKENREPEKTGVELIDSAGFPIKPDDPPLQKLLKERVRAVVREWRLREGEWTAGRGTLSVFLDSGRRVLESRLPLIHAPSARIDTQRQYVLWARELESRCTKRFEADQMRQADLEQVRFDRLDAEVALLKLSAPLPEGMTPPALPYPAPKEPAPKEIESRSEYPSVAKEFAEAKLFAIEPNELELQRHVKERANCAIIEFRMRSDDFWSGRGILHTWLDAARRARDCRAELAKDDNEREKILDQYHLCMKSITETEQFKANSGCAAWYYVCEIVTAQLGAEIDLLRVQRGRQTGQKPAGPYQAAMLSDKNGEEDAHIPEFLKLPGFDDSALRLHSSLRQKANWSLDEVIGRFKEYRVGRGTLDILLESAAQARNVRVELTDRASDQLDVLTKYRDLVAEIEKLNRARFDVGSLREQDLLQSTYKRLSAEIDLLKTNGGK
ncbi:MAG: hypothetical protein ACJ8C4_01110 [Gemmataceae bacterium]